MTYVAKRASDSILYIKHIALAIVPSWALAGLLLSSAEGRNKLQVGLQAAAHEDVWMMSHQSSGNLGQA